MLDLSLLSPEVRGVIITGTAEQIADMAAQVRGRDTNAHSVLLQVLEALRQWDEFEKERGSEDIEQGAVLMQQIALDSHHYSLPLDRAKSLMRVVYMFERAFHFDPDDFFHSLLNEYIKTQKRTQPRAIT